MASEGLQTEDGVLASVKRTLYLAMRSRFGVRMSLGSAPLQLRQPKPKS